MSGDMIQWVASKLKENVRLDVVSRTPEGFLVVRSKTGYTFLLAVINMSNLIAPTDVKHLFSGAVKPQLVVNVPSKTLWSGAAIHLVHMTSAAFGTLGDVARAAAIENAGSFRDEGTEFFIKAMKQHTNVSNVSYVYDSVFKVERKCGPNLIVAVVDAYNMSAEDVRNARDRVGHFDVVVKSSNYGSITAPATAAAIDMGTQALAFRELMQRLGK
ncbi:hypothetical protein HC248_00109 [Polaromonas vacuolata]|uniref:Uncharacterized protein n=1 Tax=Polaromonas vacuolata TaxID=37448 RepID=A0A6H2H503_9BURK|nr:hypothetical protein [Polaromonas vacuolata]QJC54847.1 hypothetical protein HC248_00109 [Polaromonas vacuolata]